MECFETQEDAPTLLPIPTAPPKLVLDLVLQKIPSDKLVQYRLVCKDWDDAIGQSPAMDKLRFRVGNDPKSIQAFRTLSASLKVKNFLFENLNLEEKFFKDPIVFRRFSLNHCSRISKLNLRNCCLHIGRFIELLAFCKRLKSLGIRQCPSLYQVDLSIIQWEFCFKYVHRNFEGLSSLKLIENIMSGDDLWNFTCNMKSLRSIKLAQLNNEIILPCFEIVKLLKSNSETLASLSLVGKLLGPKFSVKDFAQLDGLPQMNALTSVHFLRGYFQTKNHSLFLQNFLEACPKLCQLRIENATIEENTLWSLEDSLTDLHFHGCSFAHGTFRTANWTRLQDLKIILSESVSTTGQEAIVSLLQSSLPMLESLELHRENGGTHFLKAISSDKLPKLKNLSLKGFVDIKESALRKLFSGFTSLKSFALIDCKNLTDDNFCGAPLSRTIGSLACLQELNFTGTMIGNQTVREGAAGMKNLESLRLDRTRVDKAGLEHIMETVAQNKLPALCYVSLTGSACKISKDELMELKGTAPHVNVTCNHY